MAIQLYVCSYTHSAKSYLAKFVAITFIAAYMSFKLHSYDIATYMYIATAVAIYKVFAK